MKGNYNKKTTSTKMGKESKAGDGLSAAVGDKPLNPEWVECFMGFPVGWTEI